MLTVLVMLLSVACNASRVRTRTEFLKTSQVEQRKGKAGSEWFWNDSKSRDKALGPKCQTENEDAWVVVTLSGKTVKEWEKNLQIDAPKSKPEGQGKSKPEGPEPTVLEFLRSVNLEEYYPAFEDLEVKDFQDLQLIEDDELVQMGVKKIPRRRFFRALKQQQPEQQQPEQHPAPKEFPNATSIVPHAFRDHATWNKRLLMWTIADGCQYMYYSMCASCLDLAHYLSPSIKFECDRPSMVMRIDNSCTMESEFVELDSEGQEVCAVQEDKSRQDVFLLDLNQNPLKVEPGTCVKVSRVNPSAGLNLQKLNDGAKSNRQANDSTLSKVASKAVQVGKETFAQNVFTTKTIPACLCCKLPYFDVNTGLASQCRSVYAFGAQNANLNFKSGLKFVGGAAYKAVKDLLFPLVGGIIMTLSEELACTLACEMRAHKFEEYKHARMQEIPGLALTLP